MILETFPDKASGLMQAFVPNLRREKFQDARVRLALNYAFDFESIKDTIFFGQYKRINSYFSGTELASSGLPTGQELEILETRARQGAAGGLHDALRQSGRRHAGEGAREPAEGAAAPAGGRLRAARAAAGQREDRRAASPSSCWTTIPTIERDRAPLSAEPRQDRHRARRSARSTRRNMSTACATATST